MSVREELVEATGIKASKKETPEAFRQRLIEAIDELEDSDYKKLSKDTRAWLKSAISEFNENGVVPDFADDAEMVADEDDQGEEAADEDTATDESDDDADEVEESDEEEDSETEDEDVTHTDSEVGRRSGRKIAAKKSTAKKSQVRAKARDDEDEEEEAPVAKKATKAKSNNSSGAKAGGGLHHARKLLAQDPAMEVADLAKAVKKAGYSVSSHTLSTTASGFRASVKALQEEGLLKRKLV